MAYGFLVFHLYQIQLVKGGYYLARAQSELSGSGDASANRGAIYFTDDKGSTLPAAVNQQSPVIYAVPSAIKNPTTTAAAVAPIVDIPAATLVKLFSKPNDQYELLVKKADQSIADKITALDITGVVADHEPERFYPLGKTASQVLGYVGPSASSNAQIGHYGIEGFYNIQLQDASDITLTIDPNVQIEAEKILDDLVAANGATGGSVIVEDPATGQILAMGGDPSFDPNDYGASPLANYINTDVQGVYEPGSIMKVITMAAGIDSGKIGPDDTYTDKGYLDINKAHITNYDYTTHGPYGAGTTMTQVIEHSINTGAVWAENQTGNANYLSYLQKFGFGEKTGIDLPGEVSGNLSQLTVKAPQVNWDTAAYGQGVAVTPIELVSAISAIANGGVMMRPYLNAAQKPQQIRRVLSASTASTVTQMMVDAVDLAQVANINGYALAGKTGSAYVPNPAGGGYLNLLDDSYIGFGPVSNPRFVAFIRLNSLPVTSLAAESVVPAFKQLSQFLINYYNIAPDRTTDNVIPNCKLLLCGQ
ncbi:MAG: penicillin-binding protein 2 [Candidatus Pacebacteria bacterium]|nr:penicillin-binding protein 2 [Candidatus Paceibacterota bacterium]